MISGIYVAIGWIIVEVSFISDASALSYKLQAVGEEKEEEEEGDVSVCGEKTAMGPRELRPRSLCERKYLRMT